MPGVTSARRGAILVGIARGQIASALTAASPPVAPEEPSEPWLYEPGASFVTLRRHGALRGCVGSLVADGPLIDDLRHNAVAAALKDPRFAPLVAGELDEIDIEVTLLGELEPMSFTCEADALAQLCPGEDGVVLRWGERRATFLPQVWENLPSPADFLAHLKRKAGLSEDFWDDSVCLERYRAHKWSE